MAVISRIRKHSGLLVGIIGLSIAGFVVQDGLRNRRGGPPKYLAKINGHVISYDNYNTKVDEMTDNYLRQQPPGTNLKSEDMAMIRNLTWDNMLNDVLMRATCDELGVTVSKKEVNDMFYGTFVHPSVRQAFGGPAYDKNNVIQFINNFDQVSPEDQKLVSELEHYIKDERLKMKYYQLINKGFYTPKAYAEHKAKLLTETIDLRAVTLPYSTVKDEDVKLTDSDYKNYYNKYNYLLHQDASRAVDYVVFEAVPSPEDMAKLEEHVAEYYAELQTETNIADFVNAVSTEHFDSVFVKREQLSRPWDSIMFNSSPGTIFAPIRQNNRFEMAKLLDVQSRPDSLRASHILLTYAGGVNPNATRSKEEVKLLADSLCKVAKANPAMFAQLATENTEDNTKEKGGDLGWMHDGQIIKEVQNAIVKGNIGDILVVESPYGYHVLNITGKTAPVRKVMAAFVYVPIEPSSATRKEMANNANQFLVESKTLEDFKANAAKKGLQVRSSEYTANMDYQVPGLSNARDIVRWAYDKKTKEGAISEQVYEYDNTFVVAALREIREKGIMPFEQFKKQTQAEFLVKREKKSAMLIEKAQKTNAKDLNTLAAMLNLPVDTAMGLNFNSYAVGNSGYEPEVLGYAFGTKVGKMTAPIKGNSGVYVITVDQQMPGTPEMADMMRQQMKAMFQQRLFEEVNKELKEHASITDNRYLLY